MEMAEVGVRKRKARATLAIEAAAAATSPAPNSPKRRKTNSNTSQHLNFSPPSFLDHLNTNGSLGLHQHSIKLLDLEVHVETSTCNCGRQIRREMRLSSELRTNSEEVQKPTTQRKMPTELELEEFFAAGDKDIQKRFSDTYNYDIVKDMPLEGRYEWVQLKP